MVPRLLVIMAVLGFLVGAAGLVQARGGHGRPHYGEHRHAVPGPGFHGGGRVPPSGGWRQHPGLGTDRRAATRIAMTRWASILRCSDVPTRGSAPRP